MRLIVGLPKPLEMISAPPAKKAGQLRSSGGGGANIFLVVETFFLEGRELF